MWPNLWISGNIREVDGMSRQSHVLHMMAQILVNKMFKHHGAHIIFCYIVKFIMVVNDFLKKYNIHLIKLDLRLLFLAHNMRADPGSTPGRPSGPGQIGAGPDPARAGSSCRWAGPDPWPSGPGQGRPRAGQGQARPLDSLPDILLLSAGPRKSVHDQGSVHLQSPSPRPLVPWMRTPAPPCAH